MQRFTVEKHPDKPMHYICTDNESGIFCTFEHGNFCGKKVFTSPAGKPHLDYLALCKLEKEMGDYLIDNHRDKFWS